MSKKVTLKDFVRAETATRFAAQQAKAPVNAHVHDRVPVTLGNQSAPRPDLGVLRSYAVVDVTDQATISVAPSSVYQADQVIDEQHYTVGVVYPGEALTVRNADLSSGTHVFVLGRTALAEGVARAHELQDLRRIDAATANPYRPEDWDDASRLAIAARLERRADAADLDRAFGTPLTTISQQHVLGTRLDWGRLPPEHGQYHEGVATSTGCEIWTFEVPPLDVDHHGWFSVVKYDARGRLDLERAGMVGSELTRNGDGSISVYFGDEFCIGRGNIIAAEAGETFRYAIRLYRPRDVAETRDYVDGLRARPVERVLV
ncbi:DUF1214 domain-containing protein [Agromyces tropicus]|uniref:DUF1214 domain-containing protein n=1 Tax=Agromyces tropicus TaxID=555371 RepID=A0ABP5GAU3_9MICO